MMSTGQSEGSTAVHLVAPLQQDPVKTQTHGLDWSSDREGVGDADEVSDGDDVDGVGDNDAGVGEEGGLSEGEAH